MKIADGEQYSPYYLRHSDDEHNLIDSDDLVAEDADGLDPVQYMKHGTGRHKGILAKRKLGGDEKQKGDKKKDSKKRQEKKEKREKKEKKITKAQTEKRKAAKALEDKDADKKEVQKQIQRREDV